MNTDSVAEFANRVERMCDFFIAKYVDELGRNGSDDLIAMEKLKEEAVGIQVDAVSRGNILNGFDKYMKGMP